MIGKFLNQYNVKNLNKTRLKLEKLFSSDDYNKISLYLYKNKLEKLDKNMLKTKYINRFILSVMVLCLYQCLHILKYGEPNKNIKNFLKYIPLVKFPDKIQETFINTYFVFSYNDNCYTYLDDYSFLNGSVDEVDFKFDEMNNDKVDINKYIDSDGYVNINKINKHMDMEKYMDMGGYVKMNFMKDNNDNISHDYVEPIEFRARKTKSKEYPEYDVPRSIRFKNNNVDFNNYDVPKSTQINNNIDFNIYDVPKSVRDSEYQNIEYIANKMLKFHLSFEDLLKESQYDEIPFTSQNYKQQLMNLNRSINNLLIK